MGAQHRHRSKPVPGDAKQFSRTSSQQTSSQQTSSRLFTQPSSRGLCEQPSALPLVSQLRDSALCPDSHHAFPIHSSCRGKLFSATAYISAMGTFT